MFRAPDGANVSPRTRLSSFLGQPQYVNFVPESGVFAVHSQKDLLISLDNEKIRWGGTACQRSPHIELPNEKTLSPGSRKPLSDIVYGLWRYCGTEEPGGGFVLLCDRKMYRRLIFNERPPGAVTLFFDWFMGRYQGGA